MPRVFLFAGQSNAQGYGNRTQLAPVPAWAQNAANGWAGAPTVSSDTAVAYAHPTAQNAPSLYVENNTGTLGGATDGWGLYDGCNPPFGTHPNEQGGYGPELAFLARYRADHPGESIAAVKVVLGGSSVQDWLPDGSMYPVWTLMADQAAARLSSAAQWAGLVWMQGESGASDVYHQANDQPPNDFASRTRAFFAAVRARTRPDLPVALGRVGDQMLHDDVIGALPTTYTPQQYRDATNKRRADQVALGGDPGCAWWDEDGLPRKLTDAPQFRYHHADAGYLAAGERAYAAWQRAAGEVSPPPTPPLAVRFNGSPVAWAVALNGSRVGGPGDTIDVTG